MRNLKSAVVFAASMFGIATSALAGAGVITTTVTPLSGNVTYSIPGATSPPRLDTFVGYTVSISNDGGNTINNIRFTGAANATDGAEKATFNSVEGATCVTTTPDLTAIECTIGQLTAGQSFASFAVFFKAPAKITNGVADVNGQDSVNFAGITYYAEGTGGPNSVPQNSTKTWAASAVALGTDNPLLVKSTVPKSGGKFFTGAGGISTGADRFTTTVTVPAAATFTTAQINESEFPTLDNCTTNFFFVCFKSDITIGGTFSPYLTFVLRQDALNIRGGTKIGSVVIQYVDQLNVTHIVGDCASPTTPRTDFLPCIAKRVDYKNSRVPGWTTDLDGDFEWTLINLKNGSIRFP